MSDGYAPLAADYALLFPLNERQRAFFAWLLEAAPAASVVDVGCGTGEHLAWFSARGLRAWGLEPDEAMFRELGRRQWPGPAPRLLRAGVEALPAAVAERVDLALCLGNTLPHLPDRDAVRRALRAIAATLSPPGRAAVQTVSFDRIAAEGAAPFPVLERTRPDGAKIAFHRAYDLSGLPGRVVFQTRLVTPEGERRTAWPLLALRREELVRGLRDAGLAAIEEYGDYDRSPFTASSPALVLVAGRTGAGSRAAV